MWVSSSPLWIRISHRKSGYKGSFPCANARTARSAIRPSCTSFGIHSKFMLRKTYIRSISHTAKIYFIFTDARRKSSTVDVAIFLFPSLRVTIIEFLIEGSFNSHESEFSSGGNSFCCFSVNLKIYTLYFRAPSKFKHGYIVVTKPKRMCEYARSQQTADTVLSISINLQLNIFISSGYTTIHSVQGCLCI